MSLDKWIPGYKPRENKEVSHDRRSYIPHSTTKEKYSNEYIKQRIENDPWIYDPRCQKIWYQSKFNNAYENDEWHTNSGHFNYIAPFWKKNRGSKEELYHIILANKNKHLRTLLKYFESDLKQHIRTMRDFAKSRDMKYTEIWKEHSLEAWKNVNMVREELNLSQIPMPDIFKLSVREIVIKVLEEQKLKRLTNIDVRYVEKQQLTFTNLEQENIKSIFQIKEYAGIVMLEKIRNFTRNTVDVQIAIQG